MRVFLILVCCLVTSIGLYAGEGPEDSRQQALKYNYETLRLRITSGKANMAQVRQALTDTDVGNLTNTVHALYSMRGDRGVNRLIYDLWQLKTARYPELSWQLIETPPVRLAVASTISRMQVSKIGEYLDYMRTHRYDEHEFNRAQVVVGLGFSGYREDIEYIKEMASDDNHYVAQTAISSLGLMNRNAARAALVDLWLQTREGPKKKLIEEILKKVYNLVPREKPLVPENEESSATE